MVDPCRNWSLPRSCLLAQHGQRICYAGKFERHGTQCGRKGVRSSSNDAYFDILRSCITDS